VLWRFGLQGGLLVGKKVGGSWFGLGVVPWRAGDAVAGDSAKVSRSLRRAEDCLRAELKREFCDERQWGSRMKGARRTMVRRIQGSERVL
jgi:hypothetical protein